MSKLTELEARIAKVEHDLLLDKKVSSPDPFYFRKFPLHEGSSFARVVNVSLRLENGEVILRAGDVAEASAPYRAFLDIIERWPR